MKNGLGSEGSFIMWDLLQSTVYSLHREGKEEEKHLWHIFICAPEKGQPNIIQHTNTHIQDVLWFRC